MGKQLELFPELDLESKEPIQYDHGSGQFINKFSEKKKEVPTRKPNALPPKTKTIQKFKDGSKPKYREENFNERLERMHYEYDNGPKPKHYDNPYIVDSENFKKPPKKFDSQDSSTFPSDRSQKQKISTWDLIVEDAKNNPGAMKEIRQILKDNYKSNPKSLTEKELAMIGRSKKQLKETIKGLTPVTPTPVVEIPKATTPAFDLNKYIKEQSDLRLKQEQEAYEKEYGKGGIPEILKPQ